MMIKKILTSLLAICQTVTTKRSIRKRFPYLRLSNKDKIADELGLYFNMTGLVNPIAKTKLPGVDFSQAFSEISKSTVEILDQTCKLYDSHSKAGLLYLCNNTKVINVKRSHSFTLGHLSQLIPPPVKTASRIMTCRAAFFAYNDTTVHGFYVFCSVNDITPEPEDGKANEIYTYIFFNDVNKEEITFKKLDDLHLNFENDIQSVYKENNGVREFLQYQENNRDFLLYHRLFKKNSFLDLLTINYGIKVSFGDFIIKNIFSSPKNLKKKMDFIIIGHDQSTPDTLQGYFINSGDTQSTLIIEKFKETRLMMGKKWHYFVDEKFSYEVRMTPSIGELVSFSLVVKKNIDVLSCDIVYHTEVIFNNILIEPSLGKVKFISNGNSSIFFVMDELTSTFSYVAVFDKKNLNLMFRQKKPSWISLGPLYDSLILFTNQTKPDEAKNYILKLGQTDVLFNGSKIVKKSKKKIVQKFRSFINMTSGFDVFYFSDDLEISGEIVNSSSSYVEVNDMDVLPLKFYNKVPISLPIDEKKIRGSNLDFELVNIEKKFEINTKIISEMNKVDLEKFEDNCEFAVVDEWLVYIKDDKIENRRTALVYEILNIQEDGFNLEKKSGKPIMFETNSLTEKIVLYKRKGRYLVLTSLVYKVNGRNRKIDHYNIYIAYEPNFASTVYKIPLTSIEIEMIPNTEIKNSKTLKLFVVDIKNREIKIYKVYAEVQKEMELLSTLNQETVKMNFCPRSIQRGIVNSGYMIISSECPTGSYFYIYNIETGNIDQNMDLKLKNDVQTCLFFDQVLVKVKSKSQLFGKKISFFDDNNIDYVNPIKIDDISDFYCSTSTKIVIIKKRTVKKIYFLIFKGPNSYSFDTRIYQMVDFDTAEYKEIRAFEFKNSYLFFAKQCSNLRWKIFKLKIDGPPFELKSHFSEKLFINRENTIDEKIMFEVTSKKSSKQFGFNVQAHKVEFHPYKVETKSKKFFTNVTSIDDMLNIKGHFFGMKIVNKKKNFKKLEEEEIQVNYFKVLKTVTLSSQIRFQIDFMSRNPDYILGYHIYNGRIYILDLELNYKTKVIIDYQCTMGDHTSLENKRILIMLGCNVDNALRLVSYVVDISGSPESITPIVVSSHYLGLFTDIKIYKMIQDKTFLLRVDFEDFNFVNLYKYTMDIRTEDEFFVDLAPFRMIENCTSFTSVGSVGYRVFFFTTSHVYNKIQYIFFRQENTFRIFSESYIDIGNTLGLTLYSESIYCTSPDIKGTEVRCLLINKGIDFYEIKIDFINANPPHITLIWKTEYRKYYDYEFEDLRIGEKYFAFQGFSKSLGNRILMIYKRKIPSEKSTKSDPGYLHFSLGMGLFRENFTSRTRIEMKGDSLIILANKQEGMNRIVFQKIELLGRIVNLTSFENRNEKRYENYNLTFLNPMKERKPKDSYNFGKLMDEDNSKKSVLQLSRFLLVFFFMLIVAITFYALKLDYQNRKLIKDKYSKSKEENEVNEFYVVRLKGKFEFDGSGSLGTEVGSVEQTNNASYGDSYF